jgi:hypothetical protein
LILTSNRVGTFDEAFKSRIQLALHFDNLDTDRRAKIWAKFIDRLAELNEDVDFDDVSTSRGFGPATDEWATDPQCGHHSETVGALSQDENGLCALETGYQREPEV